MFEDFSFCTECGYYDQNDRLCKLFDRTMVAGCHYGEERKPRTNADRIRAMNDDELAAWIWGVVTWVAAKMLGEHPDIGVQEKWVDWLKEEVP